MRGLVAIAALGLAVGTSASAATGPEAVVEAFHAALAKGDTAGAAALLADDALIFEEGHAERSKAEYAARHLPADAEFAKAVRTTMTRRASRSVGGVAWVASEGRLNGTFRGRAIDRMSTETMILQRTNRGWKIRHVHWSSSAAP